MVSITEFHRACQEGTIYIVRQYIAEGGNVDVRDDFGWTALIWAAESGHPDIVSELLSAGANVNLASLDGKTPLIFAAQYGRIDSLRLLIAAGANINAQDDYGWTALMTSAGKIECITELLSVGADVNILRDNEYTALTDTILYKNYDAAILLVKAGADIYIRDRRGNAAIDKCGNRRIKEKLIKLANRHIRAAVKSAEKPVIIKGFDAEL